jgi:hypothetical protein
MERRTHRESPCGPRNGPATSLRLARLIRLSSRCGQTKLPLRAMFVDSRPKSLLGVIARARDEGAGGMRSPFGSPWQTPELASLGPRSRPAQCGTGPFQIRCAGLTAEGARVSCNQVARFGCRVCPSRTCRRGVHSRLGDRVPARSARKTRV